MPTTLSEQLVESVEVSAATILVHLSKAPIDPVVDTLLLSQITEADFPGYGPYMPTFEPCDVDNDQFAEIATEEVIFEAEEIVTVQQIYFAYMTHQMPGALPRLVGIYEFSEPILVEVDGQQISTGAWRMQQIAENF